jgi:ubiquitin C-terminal hydrolase
MMKTMYNKEYSEMLNIFYGIHVSEISSLEGDESLSLRPEPFSILSLPIPTDNNSPSLHDCLNLYCAKEELSGENAWMNDKTNKKEDVNRGIIFWNLPNILIIDLKRWSETGVKINKHIEAPMVDADFSAHVRGYNKHSNIYDLYGVCNHSGGALGGHYTAYVKNANGKWYEFNDTSVKEIDDTQIVTSKSYCFFYRKKTPNKHY